MDSRNTQTIEFLQHQAASLLLYQSVLSDDIGQAFLNLLQTLHSGTSSLHCLRAYGDWFITLAAAQHRWQDHLLIQILQADNPFTRQAQHRDLAHLSPSLLTAAHQDLRALQHLYLCSGTQLSQWVQAIAGLPTAPVSWEHCHDDSKDVLDSVQQLPIWDKLARLADWTEAVELLAQHYRQAGIGLFAQYWALRWQSGTLVGISYPDPIQLEDLVGYESQRDMVVQNTEALLAGYPSLHILLCGSRGSGKSSLIKGLLHEYGDRGLRLIEVAKADLKDLVAIADQLRTLPQKFVLFVDDLSFEADEDGYKALKVVLEGNLTARPQNLVVYATSNRRHLIREFFGDRPRPSDADDVHAWDTVQEKLSFSDRFGLTITFEPADQTTYLAIVHHLARQANLHLDLDINVLNHRALQWATRHNGRSGRTARQFVDFLRAELAKP